MTKGTKTLLWVLGGTAVVGAAGTAIYFATKTPAATGPQLPGGGAVTPPGGGGATPPPLPPKSYVATFNPVMQSFAQWLSQNSKLIDQSGNQ